MTAPHPDLLPPLNEPPELAADLDRYAKLLEEILNYGSRVLAESIQGSEAARTAAEGTSRAVAILQIRWCLDLLGSVAAQVRAGWIDAASVAVRSEFEVAIGFKYLVFDEATRAQKAYAYLVTAIQKRINALESFLPDTQRGKELRRWLAKDEDMQDIPFNPPEKEVRAELNALREVIEKESHATARDEYRRTAKARSKPPEWYSLFDGPQSLQQLAVAVGAAGQYEIFYRGWSQTAHGADVVTGNVSVEHSGLVGFSQLRRPNHVPTLVRHAATLAIQLLHRAVRSLAPANEEEFGAWYRSIRAEYLREAAFIVRG